MWLGIENSIGCVKKGGLLFIAIYNDQGLTSHIWWLIKWLYNKMPKLLNHIYACLVGRFLILINILKHSICLKPNNAIHSLLYYNNIRGMSLFYDMIDWVGGFPFEFTKYKTLIEYMKKRGFRVKTGVVGKSLGCHQLVLQKK